MANPWDKMLTPQFGSQQMAENSPLMNPAMQMPVMQAPIQMPMKSMSIRQSVNESGDNRKYQNEFDDQFKASMDTRGLDLNALKEKLAQLEVNKPGMLESANLKPLMAFADSLTGGRSAQSYDAPTAAKDHASKLERFQKAISDNSNSISDDQLSYLKNKMMEQSSERRFDAQLKTQERMADKGLNSDETVLRKEYQKDDLYKSMSDVNQAWAGIESNPGLDGPSQQAMVYQFSKLLDPGSVVRETEYAMSAANAGKVAQARNYFKQLEAGTMLNADQIRMMKEVSKGIFESSRGLLDSHNKMYTELSMRKGVNPQNVVVDPFYKSTKAKTTQSPSAKNYDSMSDEELTRALGQ